MGKPGGDGLCPASPDAAAKDAQAAATTDKTGLNCHTKGDVNVQVKDMVCQTEADSYIEVKGAKGEVKIGGFLELTVGLKHSIIAGLKTTIDLSYNKTFDLGPYSTEMLACKYEIIAKKDEKITGTKSDTYLGAKWEKNNKPWKKQVCGRIKKEEPLEKVINDEMTQRVGALLEATAARHKAKAREVKEKIQALDMKIAGQLRVKCEKARMSANEISRHLANIQYQCGKFQRKCAAMDEAVGGLMQIKGSSTASKASALKVKASLLKFTGSVVKLGE